jgi:hypothetical protein
MRERDIDTEKERIHVRYMMSSFRHAHSLGEAAQVRGDKVSSSALDKSARKLLGIPFLLGVSTGSACGVCQSPKICCNVSVFSLQGPYRCLDVSNDPSNCGGCFNSCYNNSTCVNGKCV